MTSTAQAPGELFTREYFEHVHEVLGRLRDEAPAYRATLPNGLPVWVVTRYADVRAALTDPRLRKDAKQLGAIMRAKLAAVGAPTELSSVFTEHMLLADPPDHTRLRALLARDFTARRIEALRPRVEQIATELLDALPTDAPTDAPADLIAGFALPLPSIVISELLGVPAADRADFQRWTAAVMEGRPELTIPASRTLNNYLHDLIARKYAEPGDDLISALTRASEDGDRLTATELHGTAVLLLVAGHETTANLLGNGLQRLLTHRELADQLRAEPTRLPAVIEELLRLESPVMLSTHRFTAEPVTIGDTTIPAGELVLVSVGAANRDGHRFTHPDELDVERGSRGHLAFGHGLHYCLGAPLARLEGLVAFEAFLGRFPAARLAAPEADLPRRSASIMHGYAALPARLT